MEGWREEEEGRSKGAGREEIRWEEGGGRMEEGRREGGGMEDGRQEG